MHSCQLTKVDGANWKLSVADNGGSASRMGFSPRRRPGSARGIVKALAQQLDAVVENDCG